MDEVLCPACLAFLQIFSLFFLPFSLTGNPTIRLVKQRKGNEDALKYGFYNKKSWKDLLEIRIPEIARAFKIPLEDLEWIAAFHGKKERPHCHLIVWNKKSGFISKKKAIYIF